MQVRAYQPGLHPRSERVVAVTRGLERGRTSLDEVEAAFRQDVEDFVRVQREAGLDLFSDGLLRWQDLFRPLAESAGLSARMLTRWFDNNAFFRAPEISAALQGFRGAHVPLPDAAVPEPRVATLPSPYLFSRAALTTGDRNALMLDLAADLLRPAAEELVAAGCRLIHLQEPWLGFHGIDASDRPHLEQALDAIGRGLAAGVVFHVYFGDAGPHLGWMRRLPVHAVGVDLVETDVASLGQGWEVGLLAGCLDARSSVVEAEEHTAEVLRVVADTAEPPVLYVSSNAGLELLPRVVADAKVARLGAAARSLQQVAL